MTNEFRTVLIASTYEDLVEYRKAAMEAILKAGLVPIAYENTRRTGGIIKEVVKKMMKKSDIFLFILGHRYGSFVDQTKKSWTEYEFEFAQKLAKPILVFLAREDSLWPASKIDTHRDQVKQFRQRIQSSFFVSIFSTPEELQTSIVKSLTHLINRTVYPEIVYRSKRKIKQVNIIKLLLSSPGDVTEERERVSRAVFRYNQEMIEEKEFFIKLIRWEDLAPQIGPSAQKVLNKQISKYDLFVGIMWNRFGTPTDIAASGTKEEFDSAIDSWKESQKPWITFYFCERPVNFTTSEQLNEKQKVLTFRRELNDMGVVRSFVTADEFEEKVYRDLIRITSLADFKKLI